MFMDSGKIAGPALDWAVAEAAGINYAIRNGKIWEKHRVPRTDGLAVSQYTMTEYNPSTNPTLAYPIVETEKYNSTWLPKQQEWYAVRVQHATDGFQTHCGFGRTRLIAEMRCFVASRLGYQIDVPDELILLNHA